jgi:DNA-3-methyladenine glycosylase
VKFLHVPRVDAELVEHGSPERFVERAILARDLAPAGSHFHILGRRPSRSVWPQVREVTKIRDETAKLSFEPWLSAIWGRAVMIRTAFDGNSHRCRRLERAWFARDALVVARALVGCFLVHEHAHERAPAGQNAAGRRAGRTPEKVTEGHAETGVRSAGLRVARIVETEAYRGPRDLASHARAGLTKRTRSLFGEEGHAYVFFVYGMHECFNVTCAGGGSGHAVLVRAGEPIVGFDEHARLDGPGRFARAMGLSRAHDGQDLTGAHLYLCGRARRPRIAASPRVGVAYAGEWADRPWRFYDPTSAHVSRPPRKSIGR